MPVHAHSHMEGRNLFESRWIESFGSKSASDGSQLGVFISHSRHDKEKAHEVAQTLNSSNVDYHFDENDEELQLADEQGDHLKVVQCIENGLKTCAHFLGLITKNTRGSWWVPYEIGNANGRSRHCAHLIDKDVLEQPSYLKAAEILPDKESPRQWLPSETTKTSTASLLINQSKLLAIYLSLVPENRNMSDLKFS